MILLPASSALAGWAGSSDSGRDSTGKGKKDILQRGLPGGKATDF